MGQFGCSDGVQPRNSSTRSGVIAVWRLPRCGVSCSGSVSTHARPRAPTVYVTIVTHRRRLGNRGERGKAREWDSNMRAHGPVWDSVESAGGAQACIPARVAWARIRTRAERVRILARGSPPVRKPTGKLHLCLAPLAHATLAVIRPPLFGMHLRASAHPGSGRQVAGVRITSALAFGMARGRTSGASPCTVAPGGDCLPSRAVCGRVGTQDPPSKSAR